MHLLEHLPTWHGGHLMLGCGVVASHKRGLENPLYVQFIVSRSPPPIQIYSATEQTLNRRYTIVLFRQKMPDEQVFIEGEQEPTSALHPHPTTFS